MIALKLGLLAMFASDVRSEFFLPFEASRQLESRFEFDQLYLESERSAQLGALTVDSKWDRYLTFSSHSKKILCQLKVKQLNAQKGLFQPVAERWAHDLKQMRLGRPVSLAVALASVYFGNSIPVWSEGSTRIAARIPTSTQPGEVSVQWKRGQGVWRRYSEQAWTFSWIQSISPQFQVAIDIAPSPVFLSDPGPLGFSKGIRVSCTWSF